jgi:hypothetical protein
MLKSKITLIFSELFHIALVGYLILLLLELLFDGFVSNVFNLNILLGTVSILGICFTLFKENEVLGKYQTGKPDLIVSGAIALMAGAIVFYKTIENGIVSIFISSLAILFTVMVLFLISSEGN